MISKCPPAPPCKEYKATLPKVLVPKNLLQAILDGKGIDIQATLQSREKNLSGNHPALGVSRETETWKVEKGLYYWAAAWSKCCELPIDREIPPLLFVRQVKSPAEGKEVCRDFSPTPISPGAFVGVAPLPTCLTLALCRPPLAPLLSSPLFFLLGFQRRFWAISSRFVSACDTSSCKHIRPHLP